MNLDGSNDGQRTRAITTWEKKPQDKHHRHVKNNLHARALALVCTTPMGAASSAGEHAKSNLYK